MTVQTPERFTRRQTCPVCGGYENAPRGQGVRCFGFLSDGGQYAHCTREEFANGLPVHPVSSTYAHRLIGDCNCSVSHDPRLGRDGKRPTEGPKRRIVATYGYRDRSGTMLYQVVRYDPQGFAQRRPDGKGGWVWSLGDIQRVLYRPPELLAANPDEPVFVCEGERDVDNVRALGLVATTNSGGADGWQDEFAEDLRDRLCVLLPHNDDAGRKRTRQIGDSLNEVTTSVRVLELLSLPPRGDVSDWLEAGGTPEDLVALAEAAPPYGPPSFRNSESSLLGASEESSGLKIVPSNEVPPPEESAALGLMEPFVPDPAALVLLSGESSAGKTVLTYNLGYHLAEGADIAGLIPSQAVQVLYFDLESPENVHRTLVDTIGRSNNLAFVRSLPRSLNTDEGREQFLSACRKFKPDVVILDPVPVAWPVKDENDNAEADAQMWAIKQMAVELNFVCITLWNMGEGNVKEKFKARGATARIDRSDLVMNYSEVTDTTRQIKIVKSRYGSLGISLTLRFAGDMGFEAVDTQDGPSSSGISQFQREIRELLQTGRKRRQELITVLGNEDMVDKALYRMAQAGEVTRPQRGIYELKVSSEPPNLGGSGSEETSEEDWGEV